MAASLDELRSAIANKLAGLLKDDEAGWQNAAKWIDKRALDEGVDLALDFSAPERFANSLIEEMRPHIDFRRRFPNGLADVARFKYAEELFWHLMPHTGGDS